MRRIISIMAACLMLSSCGRTSSLYYWGENTNGTTTYEHLAYKSYDKQTPESLCKLIVAYEDIVSHPKGTRQVPPPGICAEYGYLLLQSGTAETFSNHATLNQKMTFEGLDYAKLFRQRGEEMMKKEIELYPESERFIAPLLKRLTE